ncbi:excinuclease ABC subunit UvrA [Candidatus Aerophobetes bacterium]|nr:excinuclease ABC subunit UvrA [Candidatus Aerophobetes bacterium]
MRQDKIIIKGAREHNLKNIDLEIPRNKLVVITGLSGSGKSSLAFDTLYAEGQRRYVESLSSYARQFLEQMSKPKVDYIEGLSPAISIEQRKASSNPRSIVATLTEIYDYLRLLFAHIGQPHCYKCGRKIRSQTINDMVEKIMRFPLDSSIQILSPLVRGRKGEHRDILEEIRKNGYLRVRVDGKIRLLEEDIFLDKNKKHTIEVVVDRMKIKKGIENRLADSLETATDQSNGLALVTLKEDSSSEEKESVFSRHFSCPYCGVSYEEISPRMFSFNSPYGACPGCNGLGTKQTIDPDLVLPDKTKSLNEGAIIPWDEGVGFYRWARTAARYYFKQIAAVAKHYKFSLNTPFEDLPLNIQNILLYGSNSEEIEFTERRGGNFYNYWAPFEGVIPNLERRYKESDSNYVQEEILKYIRETPCPECGGARLRKESLAITIKDKSIYDVIKMSVKECKEFFYQLDLTPREKLIADEILKEIKKRLNFMSSVGLDYITLDRKVATLSGGEAERIRLATQIGSGLVGVIYILDEPTVGLHQRDNQKLLNTLKNLRDLGNTVIVVEHDRATIKAADYIIDLGPGPGEHGGEVVARGSLKEITSCPHSLTGKYLKGELTVPLPKSRRPPGDNQYIEIIGAQEHNLKKINVRIPLGVFICVTGVSGSGKSTLVEETLYRALAQYFYKSRVKPGKYEKINGIQHIDKVVVIDQSPIGRTPRSNPATYTGLFTPIRSLYSQIEEARMRGYQQGRFSFNVKKGRCQACRGEGMIKIEMQFLPDVYVPCDVCKGKRYNKETLQIKYKGKNIADILEMTVEEALNFFRNIPQIKRKLKTLSDVGLGYIKLGQSATTLSGGEAQRVKLSRELSKKSTGKTFYILDEPTTGLHFADIEKLLNVLNELVNRGNTVLVIEHNPDVIKVADYIIDLGPEGGDEGGKVVAVGTPEEIMQNPRSYTGKMLKEVLPKRQD